jgi:hypothetical protein
MPNRLEIAPRHFATAGLRQLRGNKMKRTIGAALAAVAFTLAAPAFAADFILTDDPLIDPSIPSFSNFYVTASSPTAVSATLTRNVGATSFLDRYAFAPTFMGVGSGAAVTNLSAALNFGTPGLRIDAYSFASPGGAAVFAAMVNAFTTPSQGSYNTDVGVLQAYLAGSPVAVYSQLGTVAGLDRQLFTVPLDPANFYVISIDGMGTIAESIYSGNLTATSVPEPATWAMMLAGFGLIGFSMRRQRQSHPKVRFAF